MMILPLRIALTLCCLSSAQAQDGPGPDEPGGEEELPATRIVARSNDLLTSLAMASERLTADVFLGERNARSTPDVLSESAGVGLQRTGPGQSSPFIRGFTGFRTLTLIDGFRLNHSAWREGPNQYLGTVDPELLDSVQIQYGLHNVRLGPDAIGAGVLLQTHVAGPFLPDRDHSSELALRLSSADRGVATHAAAGGRFGDMLYRVSATQRHFGDLRGGRHVGLQERTDFDSESGGAKLSWLLRDRRRLHLSFTRDTQLDAPRTHRTDDAVSWRGTTVGSERERQLDQLRELTAARFEWQDDLVDHGEIGLAFHRQDERRSRIRADGRRDRQGVDVNTAALFAHLEKDSVAGLWHFGLDASMERVDSFRRDFNADGSFQGDSIQGPVADDARYDLYGIYAEDELQLRDHLWLTAGLRLSHADVDADNVANPATGNEISLEDGWTHCSAELRLLQELGEQDEVYTSLSRTTRFPNLSDLSRFDSARSDEIETPSPGLDPEEFLTFEVGARHRGEVLSVAAAAYWTEIDDLIVRFPTGAVIDGDAEVRKSNSGGGHVAGVDLRTSWRFHEEWVVSSDISYVSGVIDATVAPGVREEEPLSRLPPLHGHLELRWEDDDSSVWVEGIVTVADEQDRLSSRDVSDTQRIPPGGTPGYTVYGLRGGFSPMENLDVTAGLTNLSDQDYRLHGSGVNEAGLNAILGVRFRF